MKELLISQENDLRKIYLIEDEKLVEYYEEDITANSIEGNIYLGKVQNVTPGLEAAFINIGEDKNVFIHRKDLLNNNENLPINKVLKPGEKILVQVIKDKIQRKGAKVSEKISLRGRLVVLHPNRSFITVSSKIKDEEKKKELKAILKNILPAGMGAIARTNSENASQEELEEDLKVLLAKWKYIIAKKSDEFPKKLYDSGASGTAMLLSQLTPEWMSLSIFLLLINIPLFLYGLKREGAVFTCYAVYSVLIYSLSA